ncbi:deoxyribose-phosphate aldolase [Pseudactinotalea sp. Z1732]|uniref:deoxyribose-phosphate aldolase n=1 Tax=Pseudactinotalea sp. Z1732 TaxID=3413026 RepID=UPI003C7B5083
MSPDKSAEQMSVAELAAYIDHSVLKPEFTVEDVGREVGNGVRYGCRTVCINPTAIEIAAPLCEGTSTGLCVVVDFPFGLSSTPSRLAQTRDVLTAGVAEVDIVANYGWLRSGRADRVEQDLRTVAEVCHEAGAEVKVILETDALTVDEVRAGAEAAIAAGADFIKTSTGFFTGTTQHEQTGASEDMIAIMLDAAAGRCKVKGSGSIRDRAHFLRLIDAGIDRMGIGYRSTPVVLGVDHDTAPAGAGY